jgi:ABC-type bacteriocin/lantibiotic exporters, contain an N-terminal double-glycine peptidase domain
MARLTAATPSGAERIPVPNTYQQTDYTCGPASLRAICEYFGVGPDTEHQIKADMGMPRTGADPGHLMQALVKYGLEFKPFYPMSVAQLKRSVDSKRPVILMLQAWGQTTDGEWRPSYERIWRDGHWVVAIGYDANCVFFEDPSIRNARGFIPFNELKERWHDWGANYEHMYYYGISVWDSGQARRHRAPRKEHVRWVMRIR